MTKFFLFHGDNTVASRNAAVTTISLARRINPDTELVRIEGKSLTSAVLLETLTAQSLLSSHRVIEIDGLLTRTPSGLKNALIKALVDEYRSSTGSEPISILWEPQVVSTVVLSTLWAIKDGKIQEFKLSRVLFRFLDAVFPANARNMCRLYSQAKKSEAPELLLFMLVRRISLLLVTVTGGEKMVPAGLLPWQRGQLLRQAGFWKEMQLLSIHRALLEIEFAVKSGSSGMGLDDHLDTLLASL